MTTPEVSKTKLNKCGQMLADYTFAGLDLSTADLEEAQQVVAAFRAKHQDPLTRVRLGVESMVKTERCVVTVTQRLKRASQITRKIHRMSNTSLARLQDIGGCRAVLADPDEVSRVLGRMRRNWRDQIVRERVYLDQPNRSGYRAIHIVVMRSDCAIEVQLRTAAQQDWADMIETIDSSNPDYELKDGSGPELLLTTMRAVSDSLYHSEYHGFVPEAVRIRLDDLLGGPDDGVGGVVSRDG